MFIHIMQHLYGLASGLEQLHVKAPVWIHSNLQAWYIVPKKTGRIVNSSHCLWICKLAANVNAQLLDFFVATKKTKHRTTTKHNRIS